MNEDLIDPAHQSRDMALLRRAVREKWALPDDIRSRLPKEAMDILNAHDASTKDKLASIKLLMSMVSQNDKTDDGKRRKTRTVRHIHTMEPVTDANFEHRKDSGARRLADLRELAGGSGGGGGTDSGVGSGGGGESG